jgi:[ribosomal protein S5]-alanine N-acetyltransferase
MLKGDGIVLRTVRRRDLDTLFELASDIGRRGDYYPLHVMIEPSYFRSFEEDGFWGDDFGRMVIVDETDRILGQIIYFQTARYINGLEIAYLLFDPADRGKGIMSQALDLFSRYLFATRRISRLQLTVLPGNEASRRVALKAGYQSEGVMRQAIFHRGRPTDLELFSLTREEARPVALG